MIYEKRFLKAERGQLNVKFIILCLNFKISAHSKWRNQRTDPSPRSRMSLDFIGILFIMCLMENHLISSR